ncbi:MAG: YqgE/AlgH family protein [Pseudomonadales bacterium]|nr:YqgE/AlgH family protein [Pseudomonadales bacterium]
METIPSFDQSFARQPLIAMPHLEGFSFSRSVVYLCDHDESGVMGFVVNKPSSFTLSELFDQLGIECENPDVLEKPVLSGGPVQPEAGFVLHEEKGDWDATQKVGDSIYLTGSPDILHAIAKNRGPKLFLVIRGYAGWGGGQLEQEINENSWLMVESKRGLLFDCPYYARWENAAKSLGVNINLLSREAGHA